MSRSMPVFEGCRLTGLVYEHIMHVEACFTGAYVTSTRWCDGVRVYDLKLKHFHQVEAPTEAFEYTRRELRCSWMAVSEHRFRKFDLKFKCLTVSARVPRILRRQKRERAAWKLYWTLHVILRRVKHLRTGLRVILVGAVSAANALRLGSHASSGSNTEPQPSPACNFKLEAHLRHQIIVEMADRKS